MSEETNIWPLIDRYLSNSMDESEKADFEIKIASDPALADMVESYNLTELVVVSNESQKLKSIMTKDLSGQRIGWKTLLLSGILVAGIGFGIYFINPSVEKETVSVEKKAIVLEKQSIEKELPPDTVKTKIIEVPKNSKTSSKVEIKKEENPVAILDLKPISNFETPKPFHTESGKNETTETKVSSVKSIHSPCENVKIEADLFSTPACSGKSNGEIHIRNKSIKGEIPPYLISVNSEEFVLNEIKDLNAGSYEIFIKDGNNCVVKIPDLIILKSISCAEPSKEFTFNPQYDPAWVIPYNIQKNAKTIRILDKWGKEVFLAQVNAGHPADWNGQSNTGSEIAAGYYLFYIEYTNGTTDKGSISILR